MMNRKKYEEMNEDIAKFVEEYKKHEGDVDSVKIARAIGLIKKPAIVSDKITYKRIRYKYKGRYHVRKIVASFTKGGII